MDLKIDDEYVWKEVPKDYIDFIDRWRTHHSLVDNSKNKDILNKFYQEISYNLLLRSKSNSRASKNEAGKILISLMAEYYSPKNIHDISKRLRLTRTLVKQAVLSIQKTKILSLKKGEFHYGIGVYDWEGPNVEAHKVPSEDNTRTSVHYLGMDNDSYFLDNTVDNSTRFSDAILLITIGEKAKKQTPYDKYKAQFIGKSYITSKNYNYRTSKWQRKTKTPQLNLVNNVSYQRKLKNINDFYYKKFPVQVADFFRCSQVFTESEKSGGRIYSRWTSLSSEKKEFLASILGYKPYDLTSSFMQAEFAYHHGRKRPNENYDDYVALLQRTQTFKDIESKYKNTRGPKTRYNTLLKSYRPLVKLMLSVRIATNNNLESIRKMGLNHLCEKGFVYSKSAYHDLFKNRKLIDEDCKQYIKTNKIRARADTYFKNNFSLFYFGSKYAQSVSDASAERQLTLEKNGLSKNSVLNMTKTLKLFFEIMRQFKKLKKLPLGMYGMCLKAEGMSDIDFMHAQVNRNKIPLSCHDSIYTDNKKDYDTFRTNVAKYMTIKTYTVLKSTKKVISIKSISTIFNNSKYKFVSNKSIPIGMYLQNRISVNQRGPPSRPL